MLWYQIASVVSWIPTVKNVVISEKATTTAMNRTTHRREIVICGKSSLGPIDRDRLPPPKPPRDNGRGPSSSPSGSPSTPEPLRFVSTVSSSLASPPDVLSRALVSASDSPFESFSPCLLYKSDAA